MIATNINGVTDMTDTQNRKIDQKTTKQVVIDIGYWEMLKVRATKAHMSIKEFLEGILAEVFAVEEKKNDK